MKKTFLAICMVAMGFLAVSCYDDSSLWNEVNELGDRVEKLEKDLQAEVENLNALQNKVNSLETSLTEAIAAGDKAVKKAQLMPCGAYILVWESINGRADRLTERKKGTVGGTKKKEKERKKQKAV